MSKPSQNKKTEEEEQGKKKHGNRKINEIKNIENRIEYLFEIKCALNFL